MEVNLLIEQSASAVLAKEKLKEFFVIGSEVFSSFEFVFNFRFFTRLNG